RDQPKSGPAGRSQPGGFGRPTHVRIAPLGHKSLQTQNKSDFSGTLTTARRSLSSTQLPQGEGSVTSGPARTFLGITSTGRILDGSRLGLTALDSPGSCCQLCFSARHGAARTRGTSVATSAGYRLPYDEQPAAGH